MYFCKLCFLQQKSYSFIICQYYELAEKETQKPDFTKTVIKSKILFGKANLLIPYENVDLYEFHPLTSPRKDSLNTAISLLKEALHIAPEEPIYYAAMPYVMPILSSFRRHGNTKKRHLNGLQRIKMISDR